MIGTIYEPQSGDNILVLARGGILVANPVRPPFLIHPDGTREELKASVEMANMMIEGNRR